MHISKPIKRAPIITILGEAGTGKTSLAALFENPIFIRAEDGMQSIDDAHMPDAFDILTNFQDLINQLTWLLREPHGYKTVVIDSITKLDRLFEEEVIKSDPKAPKSLNNALGGYGAGVQAVNSMHARVKKASDMLAQKGISVIFIAHADTEMMELPDVNPYMRFTLRLNKKALGYYVDDVDIVALLKLEAFYSGDKNSKVIAKTTGNRLINCLSNVASVTKNRYGIEEELLFEKGVNPFEKILNKTKMAESANTINNTANEEQ